MTMIVVGWEQASVVDSVAVLHAQDLDTDETWRVGVEVRYWQACILGYEDGEDVYIDPEDWQLIGTPIQQSTGRNV